MPRKLFKMISLPLEQPDSCEQCPLLGKLPKEKSKGRYTYVCCATRVAMTQIGVGIKQSERDIKHKWHRSCDELYPYWITNLGGKLGIPVERYEAWRRPYEDSLQLSIIFPDEVNK